jgi:hypothetical protein
MPEKDINIYGKRNRRDRKPGWEIVTPTTQGFLEGDGSDARLNRVRIFSPDGVEPILICYAQWDEDL